jgi:hypothetical protein
VRHICDRNRDTVGFWSDEGLETVLHNQRMHILADGKEKLGFIIGRPPAQPGVIETKHPIYVAAISEDLWRTGHGERLITDWNKTRPGTVCLWCRADIEAIDFWHAIGFQVTDVHTGGARRQKPCLLFQRGSEIIPTPSRRHGKTVAEEPIMALQEGKPEEFWTVPNVDRVNWCREYLAANRHKWPARLTSDSMVTYRDTQLELFDYHHQTWRYK